MDFGATKWSLSKLSVCWSCVFSYRINCLCGGISALQNLQRTICFLLLAGTIWSLLHLGQVRLRLSIVLITTLIIGFINFLPFQFSTFRTTFARNRIASGIMTNSRISLTTPKIFNLFPSRQSRNWRMTNCGIASGFAFGYDPTGRSVFFSKIDRIPLTLNPAMA